ncbi:MAG TPA: glycosyltransferase family 2 protein, partial [Stellaceae bacterium]|nr:glycosyltransferase family 2 protein [Stellaceae bacterium]
MQDAIASLLGQTLPPAAIIVVDDGSSDATVAIAETFGAVVTVLRQRQRGPGAATDLGLAAVTTPFVAGLDADDIWLSDK